jgi:hypothetical protein
VMVWSRDNPWRQGQLLTDESAKVLGLRHAEYPDNTVVVIATHDCDLAQLCGAEPTVEVLIGRTIDDVDGNFTHAKNPRLLHVVFEEVGIRAEFSSTDKIRIAKDDLAELQPRVGARLQASALSTFQIWLASRYRRSAFADEFETRIRDAKLIKKIAKALEPFGNEIIGIFFDVDFGEEVARNGADDTYTLNIIVLHAAEPDFNAAEQAALKVVAKIRKDFEDRYFNPLKKWQQIELQSCDAISESVLTYQDFKQLKRWRVDYISLAEEPQQEMAVED